MHNIEKSILSTILFGGVNINDLVIKEKHFSIKEYKDIFNTIVSINNKNLPIDSNFILQELDTSYENILLDIYTTTPYEIS